MPWRVEPNPALGLIEVVYSGRTTKQDIEAATAEALKLASRDGFGRFLTELKEVDIDVSTVDIYYIPDQWEGMHADRRNRSAVVVPDSPVIMQDAQFYENTCRNRGWQVRVFTERQEAVDWLLS